MPTGTMIYNKALQDAIDALQRKIDTYDINGADWDGVIYAQKVLEELKK